MRALITKMKRRKAACSIEHLLPHLLFTTLGERCYYYPQCTSERDALPLAAHLEIVELGFKSKCNVSKPFSKSLTSSEGSY